MSAYGYDSPRNRRRRRVRAVRVLARRAAYRVIVAAAVTIVGLVTLQYRPTLELRDPAAATVTAPTTYATTVLHPTYRKDHR